MADTNTYTSKQNIKKYTTQAKFDAIDKSDVPVGTEYNIVGEIEEADLSSELQAKVNLTGDGLTTEITGGKVKVKREMTFGVLDGVRLNSFVSDEIPTTGVTYFFPCDTPIGHYTTGIVPLLGSAKVTPPGASGPVTYYGLFLQNAYTENNYGREAYSLITATRTLNPGTHVYILPSNEGQISNLLSQEMVGAGYGIYFTSDNGALTINAGGSGVQWLPSPQQDVPYQALIVPSFDRGGPQWVDIREGKIKANYVEYNPIGHNAFENSFLSGTIYQAVKVPEDGGSGFTRFVLLAPTAPSGTGSTTLLIPNKGGTLATLDDIPTGGGTTYTAGTNIVIDGTTIKTKDDVTFDTAVVNALTVASTGIFTRGPINRVPNINFGTSAEPLSATGIYSFANIFTTYNKKKTTYNFKIPSVGGYADIRFPDVTYGNLVTQEQLKTIFGNQSLVGSENINLYKHTVSITGESESSALSTMNIEGYIIFYSSNSLECNSLTDLKTVLGDTFVEKAFGYATQLNTNDIFAIDYATETSIYFSGTNSSSQNGKGTVPFTMTLTLVDAVTTI